jgi:hypothetical protein
MAQKEPSEYIKMFIQVLQERFPEIHAQFVDRLQESWRDARVLQSRRNSARKLIARMKELIACDARSSELEAGAAKVNKISHDIIQHMARYDIIVNEIDAAINAAGGGDFGDYNSEEGEEWKNA